MISSSCSLLNGTLMNRSPGFILDSAPLISHLPQAGILNPLVKNNKANTNEINQIVIKKTDLINLVDFDFLTKNRDMPVTINEGMSDVKNNNPRSNELISYRSF